MTYYRLKLNGMTREVESKFFAFGFVQLETINLSLSKKFTAHFLPRFPQGRSRPHISRVRTLHQNCRATEGLYNCPWIIFPISKWSIRNLPIFKIYIISLSELFWTIFTTRMCHTLWIFSPLTSSQQSCSLYCLYLRYVCDILYHTRKQLQRFATPKHVLRKEA